MKIKYSKNITKSYDPLVSIVLPTFNCGKYLNYCLKSIVDQKYKKIEVILVDDASTDNTESVVNDFYDYIDIKYVKMEKNSGLPIALNRGLSIAKGDFIARHDADDFMYNIRINDQVEFLRENVDIDLVGSGADVFGITNNVFRQPQKYEDIMNSFLMFNPFIHPTIMFRRELFDNGLYIYNENLDSDEDYDLWSRILPRIKCENMNFSTIKYRIHNNNNGRNPARKKAKIQSIMRFLSLLNIPDSQRIAECLSEFQCSGFLNKESFVLLRKYALLASEKNLPHLGWIHNILIEEKKYDGCIKRILSVY
ncbi:MAG: glycosyltransferase [Acetobacter sp.]|nr:glycosyltransferase [Acetobacter sp.]